MYAFINGITEYVEYLQVKSQGVKTKIDRDPVLYDDEIPTKKRWTGKYNTMYPHRCYDESEEEYQNRLIVYPVMKYTQLIDKQPYYTYTYQLSYYQYLSDFKINTPDSCVAMVLSVNDNVISRIPKPEPNTLFRFFKSPEELSIYGACYNLFIVTMWCTDAVAEHEIPQLHAKSKITINEDQDDKYNIPLVLMNDKVVTLRFNGGCVGLFT
jgi:hypothetical protein